MNESPETQPKPEAGQTLAPTACSAIGEFTKANGRVRQCRVVGKSRHGLLKVQYVERGQSLVGYIAPDEFRPDKGV